MSCRRRLKEQDLTSRQAELPVSRRELAHSDTNTMNVAKLEPHGQILSPSLDSRIRARLFMTDICVISVGRMAFLKSEFLKN